MLSISCREAVEWLVDYVDHALEPAQHQAFEHHLAGCDQCVAYLRGYQRTIGLVKRAYDDAPESLPDDVAATIRAAWRRSRSS